MAGLMQRAGFALPVADVATGRTIKPNADLIESTRSASDCNAID